MSEGEENIDEIKQKISIIETLQRYTDANLARVKLTKKQFNICCPFHQDKSPSFTVYTESNTWKCWVDCGGGDVINLVPKSKNLSNLEAMKLLVRDLNINSDTERECLEFFKINKGIKAFNVQCELCASSLNDLKLTLLNEAQSILDIHALEQKGNVYHKIAQIEYLEPLLWYGNIEDKLYAMRKIGEMIHNETHQTE